MPITLIAQLPSFEKKVPRKEYATELNILDIAEMFSDTLQGEGINIGTPATFIRMQHCTLKCSWCDSLEVWPYGNEYTFDEIFDLFVKNNLIEKYKSHQQHIVLTGGSPLKQGARLASFIIKFKEKFGFNPYYEVENECVLRPQSVLQDDVSCWNNSPKLSNSGMKERARIKPDIISFTSTLKNSWFKFVVQNENDWVEIERDFLPYIIRGREQIILMPEGQSQDELSKTREIVAGIAIREGVKFTDRLHITIFNKKTGV